MCTLFVYFIGKKKFIQHYILIDLYFLLLERAAVSIWANICDRFSIKSNITPHIIYIPNTSHSS